MDLCGGIALRLVHGDLELPAIVEPDRSWKTGRVSSLLRLTVSYQGLQLSELNKKPVAKEYGKCSLQTSNSSITRL